MKKLISQYHFSQSDVAKYRKKVIDFHNKHGIRATIDAFGVSKPTIYRWKKILVDSQGKLSSLIPTSTTPHNTRKETTHLKIITYIKNIREEHPHLGKEKIKPLLDEYCISQEIVSIAISTIGKVIKRHNLLTPKCYGRYYHNPNSKRACRKPNYKKKVKRSPHPKSFGYIKIDTIAKFIDGMKIYVFNAIDIKLKFTFSYTYSCLNSRNGHDFLIKLFMTYPINNGIHTIQTDNGLEFMGEFDRYLEKQKIKHVFIYPRCPKINSFVERSNRSLQEEFINYNLEYAVEDITEFNRLLMKHLVWYNTKRVHKGLNNKSPINYLLSVCPESQKYVTHTLI